MAQQIVKWVPEQIFSELFENIYKHWADSSVDYMDLSDAFQHGFDNNIDWQEYRSYLEDNYEAKDLDYLEIAYEDGLDFGSCSDDTDISKKLKNKFDECLEKKESKNSSTRKLIIRVHEDADPVKAESQEIIDHLGLKDVSIYVDGIEDNKGRFLILPGEKEFVGCVYPNDKTAHRDYDVIFKYTDYKDLKNIMDVWLRARPYNWKD